MDRFGVTVAEPGITTAYETVGNVVGSTTVIVRVYDIMFGTDGTPGDAAVVWAVQRHTAAGTAGASVTPEPLNALAIAAEATAGEGDFTIEPTYAGIPVIELGMNQRASYRWVAAPGGELVAAAAAGAGWGLQAKSASYTGSVTGVMHFQE